MIKDWQHKAFRQLANELRKLAGKIDKNWPEIQYYGYTTMSPRLIKANIVTAYPLSDETIGHLLLKEMAPSILNATKIMSRPVLPYCDHSHAPANRETIYAAELLVILPYKGEQP